MKEKFLPEATISLTYHLFWKKRKEKEKKISIELKNIIYIQHNDKNFLKKHTYKTILLEACAIKQRKIKLKFKENQKIT